MSTTDRKQTTARLYYKPTGTGGFLNAGDVAGYKFAPEIKYAEWSSATKGSRRGRCKQPYEMHWRWTFNLNEELEQTIKLLRLASAATVAQAAAVSQTINFGVVSSGDTINLGWTWVTSCAAIGDGNPVEGTDWSLDAETGTVSVLSDYMSDLNFDWYFFFNAPQLLNYTALKNVRATGAFKILEFDSFSEVPRLIHAFDGEARILAAPDHDGSKPVEYELEITASGLVSTKKRAA